MHIRKQALAFGISAAMLGLVFAPQVQRIQAEDSVEAIIAEAEQMSTEELYKKAIEESRGQIMYGVGNSSRGATAASKFIETLQAIDPSYDGSIEWSQPKNNSIFKIIEADVQSNNHINSMTLIQDGNQIQSKMLDTGYLLNFIPKEFKEGEGVLVEGNDKPLALQTLVKVFMFNNQGEKQFKNCWDFVAEGESPMFMGVDSEPVGKNFLYMLTREDYAKMLREAFEQLPEEKQAYFQTVIDEVEADVEELGLEAADAKYALAWIRLWCEQYNEQTDDGPICNNLVDKSAVDESALIVYSKLRSVEESDSASVNHVTIAAYQDDYQGIGGYAYKHYLQVLKTSPLPWTACAFITFMTTSPEGFEAWGKDMGGYSANPACNQDHSQDGYVDGEDKFPAKNDRGGDWWLSPEKGKIVVEDPGYCAEVSEVMAEWIDGYAAR
ncbi:MAG: hypothetical protein Q4P72_04720 [Eubacteriales bacterium]|nr:hypothetical protein [Eubacteriales bacterium]